MTVRVKFCGITRVEDALAGAALGAAALGFVFHAASPRYVEPARARDIVRQLPPFVAKVGLFVNADVASVNAIADSVGLDYVQYHGDEPPETCARAPRPWIKAIRMRPALDVEGECARFGDACAWLFDHFDERLFGGSGQSFDWQRLPRHPRRPIIVAGGLSADTVAGAIRAARPYAVDVSSGIESSKGIKDHDKMKRFMTEVERVERQA